MNSPKNACQLREPKGSFFAIGIGIALAVTLLGVLDYFWIDLVEGELTLQWIREMCGVLSGNVSVDETAWIYLIVISTSFIAGMIAVKWYKALLSGIAIPIVFGIAYSMLGMSFGEGLQLEDFFIIPILFSLPYTIPSLISSLIIGSILSKKSPVWREKIISPIK